MDARGIGPRVPVRMAQVRMAVTHSTRRADRVGPQQARAGLFIRALAACAGAFRFPGGEEGLAFAAAAVLILGGPVSATGAMAAACAEPEETAGTAPARLPPDLTPIVPFSASRDHAGDWWNPERFDFQLSDWDGPVPTIWSPGQVTEAGCGVNITLDRAPDPAEDGTPRYLSGAIKTNRKTLYGTYRWYAQAPRMQPGVVWGLFTYAPEPWSELDFEFVGRSDRVELNIHVIDESGQHVTLSDTGRKSRKVDLWFDATAAPHLYEVTLLENEAIFAIDGSIVGRFGPEDMPNGAWQWTAMQAAASLWVGADPDWAGHFTWTGQPLTGRVFSIETP